MLRHFTKEQIKRIVDDLGIGMKCYVDVRNNEIKIFPDFGNAYFDIEAWEEEKKDWDLNEDYYQEIRPLPASEAYRVMEKFANQLESGLVQDELMNCLNRRKPFQHFKYAVEASDYREQWFEFRNQEHFDWVEWQLGNYESERGDQ